MPHTELSRDGGQHVHKGLERARSRGPSNDTTTYGRVLHVGDWTACSLRKDYRLSAYSTGIASSLVHTASVFLAHVSTFFLVHLSPFSTQRYRQSA